MLLVWKHRHFLLIIIIILPVALEEVPFDLQTIRIIQDRAQLFTVLQESIFCHELFNSGLVFTNILDI